MAVSNITYSNKVALNENPSVADINKVKADDMNEIKSVVNNNATETNTNATNITNLQTYSTSEVNTGKIWIDGKKIYRKVITFTTPSGNVTSWTTVASISNIVVTNIYGIMNNSSNTEYQIIPQYQSTNYNFYIYYSSGNIVYKETGFGNFSVSVTIEYTKTTN